MTFFKFIANPLDKVLKVCYPSAIVSYRMRDKRERNKRLVKFAGEHPEFTHQALANIFHIHRSRVTRILKKKEGIVREASPDATE